MKSGWSVLMYSCSHATSSRIIFSAGSAPDCYMTCYNITQVTRQWQQWLHELGACRGCSVGEIPQVCCLLQPVPVIAILNSMRNTCCTKKTLQTSEHTHIAHSYTHTLVLSHTVPHTWIYSSTAAARRRCSAGKRPRSLGAAASAIFNSSSCTRSCSKVQHDVVT
jgi:hypothetical protein